MILKLSKKFMRRKMISSCWLEADTRGEKSEEIVDGKTYSSMTESMHRDKRNLISHELDML